MLTGPSTDDSSSSAVRVRGGARRPTYSARSQSPSRREARSGDGGGERRRRARAQLERGVAGRDDPHIARIAAQVVVRARPNQADQHDLAGGGHQTHQPRAQVLGADAAVDEVGVDPTAPQVAQVHVPLDAVEVDVALDRRHASGRRAAAG